MTSESTLARFEKYSESLTQSCVQHPKIIGLVVVGDDLADFRHFLSVLVIQVGRARRFEFVHPEIGKAIANALAQRPEAAARDLLKIAEKYLAPVWPDFPNGEVDTVKDVFMWAS